MKRSARIVLSAGFTVALLSACSLLSGSGTDTSKPQPALCTWSLEKLAAQVVVVPVQETNVAAATSVVKAGAGGVILFGKQPPSNLKDQLAKLTAGAPDNIAPFVMSDEEGGSIQRLAGLVDKLHTPRWMADHWSPEQTEQAANKLGKQMKSLGVTMDLAPVLDLDSRDEIPGKKNPVGNRSFGDDPAKTSRYGAAFAKGLQDAGVVPVVKHFPGLGGSIGGNTDMGAAHTLPWDQLQKTALEPYKEAIKAGVPAIMTANASVPGLTDKPATISPEVTKVLRDDLKFNGMIVTDTLSAGALSAAGYKSEAAAVLALQAGADLLLYGGVTNDSIDQFSKITAAIVAAVNKGDLSHDRLVAAVNSVLKAKQLPLCGS